MVGRDFPVDDWLHGVARVRDKMRHWENAILLTEAFGAAPPVPTPIQLPFQTNDAWLALEIPPPAAPEAPAIERDRLLYTAHFTVDFDQTKPIAGLLVDEWSEVIPEATETTGVTFHYDRPNSEPPQCWLLALPAAMDGSWKWEELRDAVTEHARRRPAARHRARSHRRDELQLAGAGDLRGVHLPGDLHLQLPHAQRRRLRARQGVTDGRGRRVD